MTVCPFAPKLVHWVMENPLSNLPGRVNSIPVSEQQIMEIGQRIGQQFRPREVILFGSYGRGDQTVDSDIDLLVIFPDDVDKAAEAIRIRRAIGRVDTGVDVVVSSTREVAEWEGVKGTVYYYARKEGRPIYGDQPGLRT